MNIVVPSFGESVTEATVAKILVKNGDVVESGAEIVELETDKVNQVIVAPGSGSVRLQVKEGDSVSIGQSIGKIDASGAGTAAKAAQRKPEAEEPNDNPGENMKTKAESAPSVIQERSPEREREEDPRRSSTHSSRKTTDDFLDSLGGDSAPSTKPVAEVMPVPEPRTAFQPIPKIETEKSDAPVAPERTKVVGEKREKMTLFRMTIAKKLVEVKNQTAMLTTFNEVDMTEVMVTRKREQDSFVKKHGVKLGFTSFFVKASVQALKAFPKINARIEGNEIVYPGSCDIAIAVSTDRGLVVPVIRGCENLSFAAIEKNLAELAQKARDFKLSLPELTGGSFTITNGGVFGSLFSTPILNPPQSAILGMHAIEKRVVVRDDAMVIRPMMYLALSYDHRIVDGKEAVSFLAHIKANVEEPIRLALDF